MKELTIPAGLFSKNFKTSEFLKQKLDTAIDVQVKALRCHFKKDKWNLKADIYEEEVLKSVFGTPVLGYILDQLIIRTKIKNLTLTYNNDCWVFQLRKAKKKK